MTAGAHEGARRCASFQPAARAAAGVLANGAVTEEDIDGLSLFRFAKYPKIAPKVVEMKSARLSRTTGSSRDVKPAAARVSWLAARDLRWRRSFHGSYGVGAAAGTARPRRRREDWLRSL